MIQHVYERAQQVPGIHAVLVATDDHRIVDAVRRFGGHCVMTSPDHPSGTDRLTEVMKQVDADLYVNLQGDEPLVRPEDILRLITGVLADSSVQVGTLCHSIPAAEATNPNIVKVVLATNGDALYFSRARIPFLRDSDDDATYLKHVGIYAYRREVLASYSELRQPMLERAEKLEQLRLLNAGIRIRAFQIPEVGPGVDTPACLERVRAIMAGGDLPQPSLADVKLLITDVDGVLTDGSIYYNESGECLKRFHVRDGLGIRLLEESGVRVAVLSGRDSPTLRKRVSDLGVTLHEFGVKDKAAACRALMTQAGVTANETACIGDDSIDLPAFAVCRFSYAVADAPGYVQAKATDVLKKCGGQGAFRELADAILRAQGREQVFESAGGFSTVMAGVAQ